MHLSDDEFANVVEEAAESVPAGFRPYLEEIAIDIEDEPDARTLRDLGLRSKRSLLGLYRGTPITDRHVEAPYRFPERIVIYQRNIERICRSREAMIEQIRKTVLHEIGHHFGLDEDDLEKLGYG
jgi:predicted Zn-dependent protease with MMP-like domain